MILRINRLTLLSINYKKNMVEQTSKMISTTNNSSDVKPYASKFFLEEDGPRREYFAIAPMVDVSDRHFRYFMRLMT